MYASLHNHTDHSNIRGFLDSINRVSDLIVYSQKLGHNGIAITDHDTVSNHISAIECIKELRNGTSKLYKKAPKFKPEDWNSDKFKLILGNEIYLCSRKQIEEEKDYKFYHFILLAKDKIGHRQIRELSTKAWVENSFTWVIIRTPTYFEDLFEVVEKDKGHLIASTACLGGQLPNLIWNAYCQNPDNPDYSLCYKWIKRMVKCFGVGNFFLEMQPSNQEDQIIVNKVLLKISEELNIPYIITLDAHYLKKEDRPIHEAFLKSDEDESKGREVGEFYATTYLMSEAEIHSYMDDYLGKENVQKGLNNTQLIWEQIEEYDLDQDLVIPYEPTDFSEVDLRLYNKYVSKIPYLKDFYESDYIADKHLVREIINRVEKDFDELGNQKTYDAINTCLKVVLNTSEKTNAHWSAYLLQTRAFIDTIWESNSLCGPSRGCFVPGTQILMGDGTQKNIEDVQIGDKVVTHLGNIKTVKNTFSYDIEEDIYTIKGKNRYGIKCEEVHCTNNHKFYCRGNSSLQWIEAQNLSESDCLTTIDYKYLRNPQKVKGLKLIKFESSKKSHYKGKVYDLNVEDDNSFVANGYCVHNSGGGFILLYILGITQINPLKEEVPLYYWRFLHEYRASYVDVDIDCEGSKRDTIIANLQAKYGGYHRVAKVQTILTVKAKNSILISCRGLGIPVEEAQFLSSFIGAERGIQYTLQQTYYGDEENGLVPNTEFVNLMRDKYPQVWEVAQNIEGLVSGVGQHAGGVILSPDDIVNHTALMKASSGDVITQFDLHKLEQTGLIKWDLLAIDALQKEHICLDLLLKDNKIEWQGTLKDTYEKYIGVYKIERDNPKIWEMINNHQIVSFFQMEKQSGYQAISIGHPESLQDLSALNSVMRLMATEGSTESPLERYGRFKQDINLWYKEMDNFGISKEGQKIIRKYAEKNYGLLPNQEDFMMVVQDPAFGGFDLLWADKLRKSIAKKNPKDFDALQEEYYKTIKEKNLDYKLCDYVWKVLISMSKGSKKNSRPPYIVIYIE